ncbi:MAG TPA: hypothetical protein VFO55_10755 [Gemmatimonadaceae bacterium]|nr:hypothetical protein [Gemmatimonadaceae bacterium]
MPNRRLLIVMLGVTACGAGAGNPDLATEFRETPLRAVPGVQIGMPVSRLKAARPNAASDGFSGMRETISGHLVAYRFRGAAAEVAGDPAADERLLAVFVTRRLGSPGEVSSSWREQVQAVAGSKRAPDLCESLPNGGMQARWHFDRMSLVIAAVPGTAAGTTGSPRVVLAFGRANVINQPQGATPLPCPTS